MTNENWSINPCDSHPAPRCLGPHKGAREIHRETQTPNGGEMEERKLVEKVRAFKRHGLGNGLRSPSPSRLTPHAAQYMRHVYVMMQCNAKSCAWLAWTLRCGRKDDDRDRRHIYHISHHLAQIMRSRLGKMARKSIGEGKRRR